MLTRVDLLNAITKLQDELADDEIDSRHFPRRAAMSRQAHLREPGGLSTEYLTDATDESLAAFLEHLKGVRPRWEQGQRENEQLESIEMTPRMILMLEKKVKKAKKGAKG